MTDIVERLRRFNTGLDQEAAGEIERMRYIVGDLQQILLDERAHVEAVETEIGEYRAEIERLREQLAIARDALSVKMLGEE